MIDVTKRIGVTLALLVLLGFFFAFLRPFGTDALTLIDGTFYWVGLLLVSFVTVTGIDLWAASRADVPPKMRVLIIKLIAITLLISLLVILYHGIDGWISALLAVVQVLAITALALGLIELTVERFAATKPSEDSASPPRIMERLPLHHREHSLYALQAEDHYVRVIHAGGEEMVLMRLADAMAEVGPVEGLQIHRSWWVSKEAVDAITKNGRNVSLTLKSGHTAVASRDGSRRLKDEGWL